MSAFDSLRRGARAAAIATAILMPSAVFAHLFPQKQVNLRARHHCVAWLGLMAMWLVVFAPTISQMIVAARADGPGCTLHAAVQSEEHAHHAHHMHHADSNMLDACGYCDLFAHHVAAPTVVPSPLLATVELATAQIAAPPAFLPSAAAFPSDRPRGPPTVC
jgi:Protein of unknown function (DUF2946)